MFAHACKVGLEGVVSKVRDSVYPVGRSNNWVKKTCAQRETLAIAGFVLDEGPGRPRLHKTSAAELRKKLQPLVCKTQPYARRIAHKGIGVEPKLLAEVEYRAKSAEGKLRHPFFNGVARELVRGRRSMAKFFRPPLETKTGFANFFVAI